MNDLIETAAELQEFFERQRWEFCFIGGLAVIHRGEPRLTRDIDVTLLAGFSEEAKFVDLLLDNYAARMPSAREFAIENRVVLLRSNGGIPIDIALGGLPFEEEATRRACLVSYARNCTLRICQADDLIIMKAFADRSEDWRDIDGIVAKQGNQLDSKRILRHLEPLVAVKGNRGAFARLKELLTGSRD